MEKALDDHLLGNFNEDDFEFFKSFIRKEDALPYAELLKENDIPYRLEGTDVLITEAIVGTPTFPKIILKILPDDFKKVTGMIEEEILRNAPDLESHYLNDYTDRELLKILKKPDESSIEDIIITKQLLKSRGIPIAENAIEEMKQERFEELQKGRSGNKTWMLTYLILLIAGSFLFSPFAMIAGIGMGLYYWKDKSVDVDGNPYFTFDSSTRNFGFAMLIVTCIIVVILFVLAMFFGYSAISPEFSEDFY